MVLILSLLLLVTLCRSCSINFANISKRVDVLIGNLGHSMKSLGSEGEGRMLAEWMDVGSVALIGFAVALTLLHLSVRRSRSGGQSETNAAVTAACSVVYG